MNNGNLINLINIISNNNILNRSFQDQGETKHPCSKEFVKNLDKVIITNENIDNKLCCAICQSQFKQGEKVICLPCKDPHHFHFESDDEVCGGILPWLMENNNCPICRQVFPEEPDTVDDNSDIDDGVDRDVDGEGSADTRSNTNASLVGVLHGMMPPGMMPPGMMPPGMMPPGMMIPGMMPPGMMIPGMIIPGMIIPGMIPHPNNIDEGTDDNHLNNASNTSVNDIENILTNIFNRAFMNQRRLHMQLPPSENDITNLDNDMYDPDLQEAIQRSLGD